MEEMKLSSAQKEQCPATQVGDKSEQALAKVGCANKRLALQTTFCDPCAHVFPSCFYVCSEAKGNISSIAPCIEE